MILVDFKGVKMQVSKNLAAVGTEVTTVKRGGILKNNNGILNSEKNGFLQCFQFKDGEWKSTQFDPTAESVSIGLPGPSTDVVITGEGVDELHLYAKPFKGAWYLMETGRRDLMRANGVPARQKVLALNESAVVSLGDNLIVFIHSESAGRRSSFVAGVPSATDFYFEDDRGAKYPFDSNTPCLMGGNSFCDFCTAAPNFLTRIAKPADREGFEEDFLGVFFRLKSRLMFLSINDRAKIDGKAALTPRPINNGSKLSCGRTVLELHVPEDLSKPCLVLVPKTPPRKSLAILPVDNPDGTLPRIAMSESTQSITIGRSSEKADVVILEPALSRKHSQCVIYEKNMMVFDCGSSNGTYVNGEKITKKTVHPGDIVSFGDVNYFFCYGEN